MPVRNTMRLTSLNTTVLRALFVVTVLCMAPAFAYAYGYGEGGYYGYGQSAYYGYGQSAYYGYGYGQGSYQTTFIGNVVGQVNLSVTGNLSKGSGTFAIDHPLDPRNKLLFHSFVESPDAKNFYDGIVTLDANGEAIVRLPSYFDALNTQVRYQLKPIGSSMPNLYVKSEEKNNQFTIGGGVSGGRVSWQITGIRHDPYILAYPIIPEVEKGPDQLVNRGEYLHPNVYPAPVFTYELPSLWNPDTETSQ